MAISPDEREALRKKFVEYRRTGERRLRNELIEAHKSLASHLARRFANRGEPFDDLLQVAYLGMLKAVERFDPDGRRRVEAPLPRQDMVDSRAAPPAGAPSPARQRDQRAVAEAQPPAARA